MDFNTHWYLFDGQLYLQVKFRNVDAEIRKDDSGYFDLVIEFLVRAGFTGFDPH